MKNFSCRNLSFCYGKKLLLENINFDINVGDVIALVGNNGVGKSTLLKIISGIYSHKGIYNEMKISYMIDKPSFYPYLTDYENLYYYKLLYKVNDKKITEVLNLVNLSNSCHIRVSKYSLGMKQRLGIAKCILNEADLYLFDEPLNGLDPEGILIFRKIIDSLKKANKTIVISSHILGELENYTNKTFFIHEKKLQIIDNNTNNNSYTIKYYSKNHETSIGSYKYTGDVITLNKLLKKLIEENYLIIEINKNNKLEELFTRGDKTC